ncbi:MAG: glutamyl-tRNA reductase [Peptococcaceae bacterium]|nr:glutamyl-tRNA reductase [Peptococcaceae bacterium]
MSIILLGLNYKSASVEIREKVSMSKNNIQRNAETLQKLEAVDGIAILSTCNRTEFYLDGADDSVAVDSMLQFISAYSGCSVELLQQHMYVMKEREAVEHLFTVAAGLDSMILGESQIQGQVQDAYNYALEFGLSSNILNTLLMNALTLGKRVRTETYIDRQAVSISSAAVELAKQELGTLENKTVLIVGAGDTSELAARHLVSNGISGVIVANRTFDRAKRLADEFGGKAVRLDHFGSYLDSADIVISCTASPKYIIEKKDIERLVGQRTKPLLFIDIAVPRDIDPAVAELDNVFLHDIDDMQNVVAQNLEGRQKEAVKARRIVEEELENFFFWLDSLLVVPTIVKLRAQAEHIKKKEVEKALRRIDNVTPREKKIIEQLAHSIVSQWLHKPMYNLRYLAGNHEDRIDCYMRAIDDLFGLSELEEPKENEVKQDE